MKGLRSFFTLALLALASGTFASGAIGQVTDSPPHLITPMGHRFLLDGQPDFPIVGEARVCPDMLDVTDPSGTATIAQSMADLKVQVLQGLAVLCGNDASMLTRLDQTLGPLNMMWQETSDGVGPQPIGLQELVDWRPPTISLRYPVDLLCGSYTSMGLFNKVASLGVKGPVLTWVQVGSSPQDGQYACLTPQKIRNDALTAVVAHTSGIGWVTIDPRNATISNGFSIMRGNNGQPNNFLAVQTVAQELQQLSGVLAAGKWLKIIYPKSQPIRVGAWSYKQTVTIIAVNTSGQRAAKVAIRIPALGKKHAALKISLKKMADATITKRVK